MNMFISLMEEDGIVNVGRLKHIYRLFSKRFHPDASKDEGHHFVKMHNDYEEALKLLESGEYERKQHRNGGDVRTALLKDLYLFSMKIFTKKADSLLSEMIDQAKRYDRNVEDLLLRYQDLLYRKHELWRSNGKTYYAHNVLMICIKQLFIYYNHKTENQLRIFRGYRQALQGWTYSLEDSQKHVLEDFFDWLEKEALGEPVANHEYV